MPKRSDEALTVRARYWNTDFPVCAPGSRTLLRTEKKADKMSAWGTGQRPLFPAPVSSAKLKR